MNLSFNYPPEIISIEIYAGVIKQYQWTFLKNLKRFKE